MTLDNPTHHHMPPIVLDVFKRRENSENIIAKATGEGQPRARSAVSGERGTNIEFTRILSSVLGLYILSFIYTWSKIQLGVFIYMEASQPR